MMLGRIGIVPRRLVGLRGIVSSPNLNICESLLRGKLVKDVERSHMLEWTVDEDETVFDATKKMVDQNVGCLCVTRQGKVVGIISERDYLCKILHANRTSKQTKVKEIATMEDKLVIAFPNDSLQDCIDVMSHRRFRHLPIADENGEIAGLLSMKDIARTLAEERPVSERAINELKVTKSMPVHDG